MKMLQRLLLLFLTLTLTVSVAADAQGQKKKKKKKAAPPQHSAQELNQLSQVDSLLHAYRTPAARQALGDLKEARWSASVMITLGRILEQEKQYEAAEARLKKASELAPKNPVPWAWLGWTYQHQKQEAKAKQAYQKAESLAQGVVRANAKNPNGHLYLGIAQAYLGKYGLAAQSLNKARELAPGSATAVYHLGVTRALQEQWKPAVDLLTKALEMDDDMAYAYYYRGQAASKINNKGMLIADFEKFIQLAPNAPEAPIAQRTLAAVRR